MLEIPLTSSPEQLFSITLSNEKYDMRVALNSRTGVWALSLSQDEVTLVDGIALVGGVDVFAPFNVGIENAYVANLDQQNQDPGRDNLGTVARLFILTDEEVAGG